MTENMADYLVPLLSPLWPSKNTITSDLGQVFDTYAVTLDSKLWIHMKRRRSASVLQLWWRLLVAVPFGDLGHSYGLRGKKTQSCDTKEVSVTRVNRDVKEQSCSRHWRHTILSSSGRNIRVAGDESSYSLMNSKWCCYSNFRCTWLKGLFVAIPYHILYSQEKLWLPIKNKKVLGTRLTLRIRAGISYTKNK